MRAHWGAGSRALADVFLPDATPELREAFTRLQRTATDAATAADVLTFTYAMDVTDLLPSVRAKTTVLHRRGDRAIAYSAGHELALGVPNARLLTLEGRDHPLWMLEGAADLVAAILTKEEQLPEPGCRFDREGRCVWLDGQRIDLTSLEFGTLARLVDRAGRVVSRDDLLETVWKQPYSGSNVVDAVVRSIRKKLGRFAASVETVLMRGRSRGRRRPAPLSSGRHDPIPHGDRGESSVTLSGGAGNDRKGDHYRARARVVPRLRIH